MTTAKHDLCYCHSLPGSICDFCSGTRVGTLDDYKATLRWYRSGVYAAAPDLLSALEAVLPYLEHPDVQAIPFAMGSGVVARKIRATLSAAKGA